VAPACIFEIDGHRMTNAPAWTGSLGVNVEHKLFATEWTGFASMNTAYRGRHNTGSNLHPYKFEDAHWFMNLNAGIRSPDGHWEVSAWSTNVLDTYDRSVVFDTPAQGGTFHSYVGPPRMSGGTVKYIF
jgi:outer membrane receptor protein involved in Fe transport